MSDHEPDQFPLPDIGIADLIDDSTSDTVSSLQSVANVFANGSPDEIFSMLPELSRFLYICPDGLFDTILPALCPLLPEWPHDLQLATATEILTVTRSPHLSPPIANLLALASVQVVLSLTLTTTALVPQLLLTFGDILAITLSVAKSSQHHPIRLFTLVDDFVAAPSPDQRLLAVKILRGLSSSDSSTTFLESAILPRLWDMIPDDDPFITAHLIATLCTLTSRYSHRKFFDRVWPKLQGLWDVASTADGFAKSISIAAIAHVLSHQKSVSLFAHPHLFRLTSFFHHICNFAYQHSKDSITFLPESAYDCYIAIATHLPTFMTHLFDHGAIHWHKYGIKAFSAMTTCDDAAVRLKCAVNLPVVCSAYRGKNTATLTRIAESLCTDVSSDVRRAMALNFQRILPYLATHSTANLFKRMFQVLIDDEDKRVTIALLDSLGTSMKTLAALKTGRVVPLHFGDAFQNIAMTQDWRTREVLAKQFGVAAKALTSPQRDEVLVLLRGLFRDDTAPVRKAAGASYLRVIRMIRSVDERWEEFTSFFDEFSPAGCTIRLSLVETLFYAADLFSVHAFSMMFAPYLLRMATDHVSNIRLKIASNLHRVAAACQTVPGYDDAIYALKKDPDTDVRREMETLVERSAEHARHNKRFVRRDAKKLAFERWLYQDRFSLSDPVPDVEDRTRSEKSEKSTARRPSPAWNKRQSLTQAFSKVKVLFARGKRKFKEHLSGHSRTRGTSGEASRASEGAGLGSAAARTGGGRGNETASDVSGASIQGSTVPAFTTVAPAPLGPDSSFSPPLCSSPMASFSMTSASAFDDASSDEWVRLPDRDTVDRFEEMSFSTASFGELTSQWMSSQDDSVAPQSMASQPPQTLEICGEYEPVKQPVSLPATKMTVTAKPSKVEESDESSSRKSL